MNDTMQNGAATEPGVQHPVAQPLSLTPSSQVCAMHVIPAVYINIVKKLNSLKHLVRTTVAELNN